MGKFGFHVIDADGHGGERKDWRERIPERLRPKLEEYGDNMFLVLKPARYHDDTEEVEFGEILIFMGAEFLITVRHGDTTHLHDVRLTAEKNVELMKHGPASVLHAIVDRIVDEVEVLEDELAAGQLFFPAKIDEHAVEAVARRAPLVLHDERASIGAPRLIA